MTTPENKEAAAVAIIESLAPSRSFLILRRARHPEDPWSGHFSFPGGRKESCDRDLFATCLRETTEETGIVLTRQQLIKDLTPEPAGRDSSTLLWVKPYFFSIPQRPPLHLDRQEIANGHWLKVEEFNNHTLHKKVELIPGRSFWAFPFHNYYIWGFTYRLLCKILKPCKK